jgi:uncharacterized protein YuzE
MSAIKLEGVSIENLIIHANGILLEVPESYDKAKAGLVRVTKDLRTDILYKVIKVGKNCGDFLGIKENYFILLQPNTTIARFTIGNKDYFTVEMTDVVLAFTEKKEPSILNAN